MIVNLENVSYMTVSGMRVELHFKDSSSYMNRFGSMGEMLATMKGWQEKTKVLHGGDGPVVMPPIKSADGKRRSLAHARMKDALRAN